LTAGYGVLMLVHAPVAYLPRLRSLFRRFWLPATVVPLALLALALGVRLRAYGITEQRCRPPQLGIHDPAQPNG
jgi:hypothetical protein